MDSPLDLVIGAGNLLSEACDSYAHHWDNNLVHTPTYTQPADVHIDVSNNNWRTESAIQLAASDINRTLTYMAFESSRRPIDPDDRPLPKLEPRVMSRREAQATLRARAHSRMGGVYLYFLTFAGILAYIGYKCLF